MARKKSKEEAKKPSKTIQNRSSIIKRVNQRFKYALKKYGQDNPFVKSMETRLSAYPKEYLKTDEKGNLLGLKNTKKWDTMNPQTLNALDKIYTVAQRRKVTKGKINKEVEMIDDALKDLSVTESERIALLERKNYLSKVKPEEYVKKEEDLHNVIIANMSAFYTYNQLITSQLQRSSNLTPLEALRLRNWVDLYNRNQKKAIEQAEHVQADFEDLGNSSIFDGEDLF